MDWNALQKLLESLEDSQAQALRELVEGLATWERSLEVREQEIEDFLAEIQLLKQDLGQSDTSARYAQPTLIEDANGITWVYPDTLPARELQVLQVLQTEAESLVPDNVPRKARTLRVLGENSELMERLGHRLPGVNLSALSASLTRLGHRGVIKLYRTGKQRFVVLQARLRDLPLYKE
jgi:hypothetical protein